jgi:CubicO group peptidase (beta-lactamase class C family)
MILRHGRLIAEGWWAPYTSDRKHLLYSLSKSFTSAAAGFAVAEGMLRLDDPVISYFPEFADDITDPRSRAMLVRHIASMASGHLAETNGRAFAIDPDEPVRGFLLIPPDREPGTVFAYNQPCTYTLAAIVQKLSGQPLTEYLRPRLFDPLGIGEVAWTQHPPGRNVGYSGLFATTDAVAKLGLLHLNGGVWEGRRLLPASWVAEATRTQISTADGSANEAPDWRQGYGFQFWMARHGYRGDGACGQFCLVLPEQDAVIAMTGATGPMHAVLDAAWEHLLPAFGDDGPLTNAGQEDEKLRQRLTRLAIPSRPDAAALPGDWQGTPVGGTCADQPSLTAVTITSSGVVRLTEGTDGSIDVRCGPEGWTSSGPEAPLPVAATCGRPSPDTLAIDVMFLETPHRLTVTCSLPDRTFSARWHIKPLHEEPLHQLCAPKS